MTELINQKLDHLLFTGGTSIGKIIAQAAGKHLTPVTLELGVNTLFPLSFPSLKQIGKKGKNPVFVDDAADIDVVAKRVTFGRWHFNAGQVCLAPEYVFISRDKVKTYIESTRKYLKEFWWDEKKSFRGSQFYPRIVSERHWKRLKALKDYYMEGDDDLKRQVVIGGVDDKELFEEDDIKERFMAPIVLTDVDFCKDKIMVKKYVSLSVPFWLRLLIYGLL